MPYATRTLQTARNTIQATRINFMQQARGAIGGGRMGLDEQGTAPPPVGAAEPFKGPMGMWPFPVLNALKGTSNGGGLKLPFMQQTTAPAAAGLGVASRAAASGMAGASVYDITQARTGIHVY